MCYTLYFLQIRVPSLWNKRKANSYVMGFASNHLSMINNKSRQRRRKTGIFPRRILHTARPGMTGTRNNKGEGDKTEPKHRDHKKRRHKTFVDSSIFFTTVTSSQPKLLEDDEKIKLRSRQRNGLEIDFNWTSLILLRLIRCQAVADRGQVLPDFQ